MYIVTVIGRDNVRRQYGYSKLAMAYKAVIRHTENGAFAAWWDKMSDWGKVYNPIRKQLRNDAKEVVYG